MEIEITQADLDRWEELGIAEVHLGAGLHYVSGSIRIPSSIKVIGVPASEDEQPRWVIEELSWGPKDYQPGKQVLENIRLEGNDQKERT